jgi:hypothetical protein
MRTVAPLVDWGFIAVVLVSAAMVATQMLRDLLGALRRARLAELGPALPDDEVAPRLRSEHDVLGELDHPGLSIAERNQLNEELLELHRDRRRRLRAHRRSASA